MAATAAGATVAALLGAGPAAHAQDPAGPEPALQTVALVPSSGASPTGPMSAAPETARSEAVVGGMAVSQRATRPFSLLGLTWSDPSAALNGTVEVRTRSAADGRWTGWQALEADDADAADAGTEGGPVRGSTDPLWAGESDGVEARVAAIGGTTRPLPAGLRLDLINPDTPATEPSAEAQAEPAPAAQAGPSAAAQAEPAPEVRAEAAVPATPRAATAVPPRPVPGYISRAAWGADEAIVKNPPQYTTDVQVLFVHHTATTNSYSCGQSAGIIRGIELYHVRSKGWNDIGYNFLVDKCGTLFEGRRGGVTRPVLGAHTLGFNSHSAAIAVIGNYTGTGAPAIVRRVVAQVAAYKLGMYGNSPGGRTTLLSSGSDRYPRGTLVALNRISGHRDTGKTECPGDALYSQLGTVRGIAAAGPAGLAFARVSGAVRYGTQFWTRGAIRPLWDLSTPSGMIARFDVLVDGAVAMSVKNTDRTTLLRLRPGSHLVTVRAVHLNGRAAPATLRVEADASVPVFASPPSVALRSGSLLGAVPVRLGYRVADAGGLRSVSLTSPSVVDLGTTATSWPGLAAPGVPTTWTVRAIDRAGNEKRAAVTGTPVLVSEAASARTGTWRTLAGPAYLGGSAAISIAAGSTMAWTFTGSSAQIAVSRTTGSGRLTVTIDGRNYGTLDLRSSRTINRVAVWAPHWATSDRHTLRLIVQGTAGRPGVIVDGLTVLR
jgi:uncharacterized protein with LGFP repeats